MNNAFSPNDLLLDQTMLCEASRLLEKCPDGTEFVDHLSKKYRPKNSINMNYYSMGISHWPPSNAERLFNLSMLLDGIALHDHLYILKAELPPDAHTLRLRQLLIKKDIVREMETVPYLPKIKQEFSDFFEKIQAFDERIEDKDKIYTDYRRREVSKQIEQDVEAFLGVPPSELHKGNIISIKGLKQKLGYLSQTRDTVLLEGLRREYEGTLSHAWLRRNELISRPFLALGEHLLESVSYFHSGAIIMGISQLRTFVYWRISEHAAIPLYPSSRRIPQLDAFASHIRLFTAEKIYQVVAQAFQENINLIYEDEASVPLRLPPSLSVFLELYRSSKDISKAIDHFRKEFAGVRQDIRILEEKLTISKTLKERIDTKNQINDVIKSISSHYQLKDDAHLETVLGFAPEILNPLTNPTDPSKYSSKLLTMPASWIKDWWKKRPFRHVFDLRKRLYEIAHYEQLASSVFNVDFKEKDHYDFYDFYDAYKSLYQIKETKK